jgi:hypothetical protein
MSSASDHLSSIRVGNFATPGEATRPEYPSHGSLLKVQPTFKPGTGTSATDPIKAEIAISTCYDTLSGTSGADMRRREFIKFVGSAAACPFAASAQQIERYR